jgi:uncharacterized protein YndB with AHSA1/START domain
MPRTVQVTITIATTPRRVIDAFTLESDLRGWWGVERSLVQPKVGGIYALAWGITSAGFQYISSGVVESYESGGGLRIRDYVYYSPERPILGPMTLEVAVRRDGDSTVVTVTQDGYGDGPDWDWYYEAVKGAWPVALGMLKAYLETSR